MSRRIRTSLTVVLLGLFVLGAPLHAASRRVEVGDGMVATLNEDQEMLLEALPLRHEGLIAFSERLTGTETAAKLISAENGNVRSLLAGVRYRVPFELLRPENQRQVIRALFGQDGARSDGWHHFVSSAKNAQVESLWRIAEWFTGDGQNYRRIRDANALDDEEIRPGQELLIPSEILTPSLVRLLPRPSAASGVLEFGDDDQGRFAFYSLNSGEALYSSVVVRFTGRIYADDVNRLAANIAERSGIRDVKDIPVGFKVKISLDLLQPEYLPGDDPRRLQYEDDLSRSVAYTNSVRSADLAGVTVILDAGHGGRDVGASIGGVWESVYVYDIMLRVRRILTDSTAAEVIPTTRDGSRFVLTSNDSLSQSRGHAVLTSPPYQIVDSRVSSNLRWYLANSAYSSRVAKGRDPKKVVFVSIHADSLHSSLRGTMIYLPGLLKNPSSYGKTGTVYTSRREVREQPRVSFKHSDRVRSEGLSRDLAQHVIRAFRDESLVIHANKPIRDRVIRQRQQYVPAVLRFNEVPAKILVEVCNLANAEDRRLIRTEPFRERVARAIANGILEYYGEGRRGGDVRVAGGGS